MSQDPASNGPVRRIDKIVNGQPFVVLAEDKSNSFETFKTYHVTISVIGSAIKVYLDGQEYFQQMTTPSKLARSVS